MKTFSKIAFVLLVSVLFGGCDDTFYLSEKETAAYASLFNSEATLNQNLSGLRGRKIILGFDNRSGAPRYVGSNLRKVLRRQVGSLESGPRGISLDRLASELDAQLAEWVDDRLELYTGSGADDRAKLTELTSVVVTFLDEPTFEFKPAQNSIGYRVRVRMTMVGVIEINAVNWFFDLFANVNGSHRIGVTIPNLVLNGSADIYSPYSNAGRIRLRMVPTLDGPVEVKGRRGRSLSGRVKRAVADVLSNNITKPVNHVFNQNYRFFSIPRIALTPNQPNEPSRLKVSYSGKASRHGSDHVTPEIHMVARGANGKLYHGRRRSGRWEGYAPLSFTASNGDEAFPVKSDPVVVHSGSGQLELAAITESGSLAYAHWREGRWDNVHITKRFKHGGAFVSFIGRPGLTASAPGQAEIIAAATDGRLWHQRRIDGVWRDPVRIPTGAAEFVRDPVAVNTGNRIVVLYVDKTGHLYGVAFDLETEIWGQPTRFVDKRNGQVKIIHAPAAVGSGENRVDVAYVKKGGSIYHRRLEIQENNFQAGVGDTGISFSGAEERIRGIRSKSAPVMACSGSGRPEIFIRDKRNRLYHNIFVHSRFDNIFEGRRIRPGWQGWQLVEKGYFKGGPKYPMRIAGFSAAGIRTGKTEVAALSAVREGAEVSRIFFDEYESGRYARRLMPWKTVHWRGWQITGNRTFVGSPAIAAIDRNFQAAHIGISKGFGSTVHVERIGRTNKTNVTGSNSVVRTLANRVNPVILSTGPGMFDSFGALTDGTLEHKRFYAHADPDTHTPALPAGITVTAVSAIAYGDGAVELAASASDRKIYVWRFRGGTWGQASVVGTDAASKPVLAYIGAGRFDLFWINTSGRLIRNRFRNNSWQAGEKVLSGFQIDPLLFGSVSVASWGDGTIDMLVVNSESKEVYHRRFVSGADPCTPDDCSAPFKFVAVGGTSREDPVLSAFGPTDLNILAMRELSWFSSDSLSGSAGSSSVSDHAEKVFWNPFVSIGGSEKVLGGTAHTGRGNLTVIGGGEGILYVNRNVNGRWTGFRRIVGQQLGTVYRRHTIIPSIVSHGG